MGDSSTKESSCHKNSHCLSNEVDPSQRSTKRRIACDGLVLLSCLGVAMVSGVRPFGPEEYQSHQKAMKRPTVHYCVSRQFQVQQQGQCSRRNLSTEHSNGHLCLRMRMTRLLHEKSRLCTSDSLVHCHQINIANPCQCPQSTHLS